MAKEAKEKGSIFLPRTEKIGVVNKDKELKKRTLGIHFQLVKLKIQYWNVRRANVKNKREELKGLTKAQNVDLVAPQETKPPEMSNEITQEFGWGRDA